MRVGHPESRDGLAPVRGWNWVGAEEEMIHPTTPHNSGMPSWYGDRSQKKEIIKIGYYHHI